ncbi:MAG: helix-turn-helix transcriptional regulator [Betaproteobacteria bacterium]|nr:helix-turn-helix transcriptional regulator [Betaproteobacteria bacterium]
MDVRQAFAFTLKRARKAKHLTQEDFDLASSRTYLSSLERAQKSPTLDKIDQLAKVLEVHPAALIAVSYSLKDGDKRSARTLDAILQEARTLLKIVEGTFPAK